MFDRKTVQALRDLGHAVTLACPKRATRGLELWNNLRGIPHNRARFATRGNRNLVLMAQAGQDLTICSWEPFDCLVPYLRKPLILITHNITSQALPSIVPRNPMAWLLAMQARWWERKILCASKLTAVAALSKKDRDYIAALSASPPVLLTVPGMPPLTALRPHARVADELVLSGTYEWWPKRRDAIRFARDYAGSKNRFAVLCDRLPKRAAERLKTSPLPSPAEVGDKLRFGIVSDRFESGHKLKTLAYVAQNQIVLSFSDVGDDFSEIPDHDLFIRRIQTVSDIAHHVASFKQMDPDSLRSRFLAFQAACAHRFTWDAVARRIVEAGQVTGRAS